MLLKLFLNEMSVFEGHLSDFTYNFHHFGFIQIL